MKQVDGSNGAESEPRDSPHQAKPQKAGTRARVLTWNINGLRKVAADHGGFKVLLDQFNVDIVCFQEIKITRAGLVEHDLARAQGYHCFFSHCRVRRKPSYSGVSTSVRSASGLRTLACTTSLSDTRFFGSPAGCCLGLAPERLAAIDAEGRVLVTDHGHFILFNVYAPCISSGDEDERTDERRVFKRDFLRLLEARVLGFEESGRHVILVGDLNSCASQLDHGFTMSDKELYGSQWSMWIRGLLGLDSSGSPRVVDCFRRLHPDRQDAFTCWNTKTGARENNYGTRIDYVIADAALAAEGLESCDIRPDFLGSDHCPVSATFVLPSSPASAREVSVPGVGGSPSEGARSNDGGSAGWPEHPPECSCFYPEVQGTQEKLAKFFVAGGDKEGGRVGAGESGGRSDTWTRRVPSEGSSGVDRAGAPEAEGPTSVDTPRGASGDDGRKRPPTGTKKMRQSKLVFAPTTRRDSQIHDVRQPTGLRESNNRPEQALHSKGPARLGSPNPLPRNSYSAAERGSPRGIVTGAVGNDPLDAVRISGTEECGDSEGGDLSLGAVGRGGSVGEVRDGGGGSGSAEAWKALFGRKKSAPLCEHGEASIQRTVVKQGANHNRRFYTCARPAGNWPTDRNARCNFFQWRLDGVRGYKDRPSRGDENAKRARRTA